MRKSSGLAALIAMGCLFALGSAAADEGRIITRKFDGFEVVIDCQRKGAVFFQYTLERDYGSEKRLDNFSLDPEVPADCQQTSSDTYKSRVYRYDRGHMVPANHLDHSAVAIAQSNMMTNILPQAANMNRGAWYETEKIAECYRDRGTIMVFGGVIWGDSPQDDFFLQSHGVATPDAFWKVLLQNGRVIGWLVPNSEEAVAKKLDSYLIGLPELSEIIGIKFPLPEAILGQRPTVSWPIPSGCNLG